MLQASWVNLTATDDNAAVTSRKDAIMFRLLDTCIRSLERQGARRVFLDGMKGGQEGFQSTGK